MQEVDKIKKIVDPLLTWFDSNARILPWRDRPEGYRVWVSEIMLQQTRVEAVKPYYERFMKNLPDIRSLAQAPEEVLLKLWEGLGYYNRVRNMQKAAIMIMEEYDGKMPADFEDLLKLPGIGSYTAGAVASIAFGAAVPAVDGNVLRVLSRILENDEDILKQSVKKKYEQWLLPVMPKEKSGAFNQSLMELGACVCLPNGEPKCEKCPISEFCGAREKGTMLEYPKKASKKKRRIEEKTVLVIQDGDHIALKKRQNKGLLAGLYEFPNAEGGLSKEQVLSWVSELGFLALHIQKLPEAKHIFSHVEWRMQGYVIRVGESETKLKDDVLFVDIEDTKVRYPIPSAFAAYTDYMNIELGVKGDEKYENNA